MILKFVDREEELKALKSLQTAAIIYGRRRVGKTALIKEFIKDRKAFYFLCQKNKIEAEPTEPFLGTSRPKIFYEEDEKVERCY